MKKGLCVLLCAIGLLAVLPRVVSAQTTTQMTAGSVEQEKEAIRAVLEKEKQGYFAKDFETMASTWLQKSSSVKIYMSAKGEIDLFGWAKISEDDKTELSKVRSDYKNVRVDFSDFQYNIYEKSAWVLFKSSWHWVIKDEQQNLEQRRIMAFEKVNGEWKITLMAIFEIPKNSK